GHRQHERYGARHEDCGRFPLTRHIRLLLCGTLGPLPYRAIREMVSLDQICFDGCALAYRRRVMRTEGDMVVEEVHMWPASLFPIGSMKSERCQGTVGRLRI